VLRMMRESASAGPLRVPIAAWKTLPDMWAEAVARVLELVEEEGRWLYEWLLAYVAMIPKAAGGGRTQNQRPITVWEVLYRLWAKGLTVGWQAVLQKQYRGVTAMGSERGSGWCPWRSC